MRDLIAVLWTCFFLQKATSQSLPYNPTSILLPPATSENRDLAYAFVQSGSETAQFVSLNISTTISPSNLTLDIISSDLSFLGNTSNAFIPSISSLGQVSVYTGSCATSTSAALWRFTPSDTSTTGDGTWEEETTTTGSGAIASALPGADFLSTAFSFSTLVNATASQTRIYVFGGMCPTEEATPSTWQSAATYSNQMLRLTPSTASEKTTYSFDLPTSRGPPIAEAGFSITGLTPTYSNGSGIQTQQQSFVLVGGHIQTAFINMSQVAIWSLPEESWSFVTVDSPAASNGKELAVKSTVPQVDSRSGHTAILTEDGSSIVVLGGWVGDVSQMADPQLAVLHLGQGYGGAGDWRWTVPDQQPSGSGMYGHGAVMLPGNVMMVLGGYNISSSGISKRDTASGVQAQFFNATSMTWVTDYTNPAYVAAKASSSASAEAASKSKSTSKKVGLGAGLGLGLAAILGALLVAFCYNRRQNRKIKATREKEIQNLSMGAANYSEYPRREMSQSSGFPWSNGRWNGQNDNGARNESVYEHNNAVAGYENLNSGTHGLGDRSQIPQPPKQIPRKPLHSRSARGTYQPTPNFDFNTGTGRANSLGTAGPIHPIYEADEDDSAHHPVDGVGIAIGDPDHTPNHAAETARYSDPFRDPPPANFSAPIRRNRSASSSEAESPARSREREIQEWVSDWAAADALLNSQARSHSNAGRISPTRRAQLITATTTAASVTGEEDSRTASNLSERTDRSINVSAVSVSRSGSSSQGRSRSNSLRGFITGFNPFATTVTGSLNTNLSPIYDAQTGQPIPQSSGSGSSNSFNTARTSFPALQAEGETLLPRPHDDYGSGEYSPTRDQHEYGQGSPSKNKPIMLNKTRAGWLGSLRKVFNSSDAQAGAPFNPHAPIYRDVSPTREGMSGSAQPRRTVSAGATLWRRKQGKGDWEDSADLSSVGDNTRSNTFNSDGPTQFQRHYTDNPSSGNGYGDGGLGGDDSDEDWDIERAVQNRVVQVMFTVPKEKLRVVNADEDMRSEGGSSVGGSLRSKKSVRAGLAALTPLTVAPAAPATENKDAEKEELLVMDLDRDLDLELAAPKIYSTPPQLHDTPPTPPQSTEPGLKIQKSKSLIFDHDAEVGKGKEKQHGKMTERERVREMEREVARQEQESPTRKEAAKKSKVADLVGDIERRGSPERA